MRKSIILEVVVVNRRREVSNGNRKSLVEQALGNRMMETLSIKH